MSVAGPRSFVTRRRWMVVLLSLFAALVLSSCRADTTVIVRARANGSGVVRVEVRLDAEAARALGDPQQALATADLEQRGWAVEKLAIATNGTGSFALERSFRNTDEANALLDELTGANGPFHGLRVQRDRSLLSTSVSVRGTVDLSTGLDAAGDAALASATGSGSVLGFSAASVERAQGRPMTELVRVAVRAEVPGHSRLVALPMGKATALAVSGTTWAWELAAGLGAIAAGALGLFLARRRHH